jgi:hypothetical protein
VKWRLEVLLKLPLCRSEHGPNDMTYFLLVNIVREMRCVPDHHILIADTLSVVEAVNVGGCVRLGGSGLTRGGGYAVVDLAFIEL